jgi:mono/diheme cytochrome c family protein
MTKERCRSPRAAGPTGRGSVGAAAPPAARRSGGRAIALPLVVVSALLLAVGCQGFGTRASRGGVEGDLETPSWEDPVAAIFVQHCNECHTAPPRNSAPDYLRTDSLDDVGDVLGVRNQIERHITRAGSNAAPMPPAPRARMSRAELRTLERWLELGMPATSTEAILAAGGTVPDGGDAGLDGSGTVDGGDAAGLDAGADADPGPPPVFADVVATVFSRRCSSSVCHGSRGGDPNLVDGDVYARLLGPSDGARGMPWITPGDPDRSYLYLKTRSDFRSLGIGSGRVMPIGTALTEAQRNVLLRWIEGGAQP